MRETLSAVDLAVVTGGVALALGGATVALPRMRTPRATVALLTGGFVLMLLLLVALPRG